MPTKRLDLVQGHAQQRSHWLEIGLLGRPDGEIVRGGHARGRSRAAD